MLGIRECKFLFLASFLIVLWTAAPLRAEPGATAKVRSVLDRAMTIQTKPALQGPEHRKERSVLIRKLISQNFLSAEMAKESLRGYWNRLSASQHERYQTLLTGIFVDSYSRQVLDFLKREKIEYPGTVPDGMYTKVQTIIMRTDEHIPVDYIMELKGRKWMIRDVLIDGVGIVETYQNSFAAFLKTHTFNDLIHRMAIQKKAGEEL